LDFSIPDFKYRISELIITVLSLLVDDELPYSLPLDGGNDGGQETDDQDKQETLLSTYETQQECEDRIGLLVE